MNFADKLIDNIKKNQSYLCAGFDPVIENFPKFLLEKAKRKAHPLEDSAYWLLCTFFEIAVDALKDCVACVKPNSCFFEQYGVAGLKAFAYICKYAFLSGLPVIADAKRGDIGSSAKAYASAFLGGTTVFGEQLNAYHTDAVTVSPFLGFDTVEVFVEEALKVGKGVFILVRTSNPGSGDIQDAISEKTGKDVSSTIADWVHQKGKAAIGKSGYSSVGAVLGATHPDQARALRALMPNALVLIPGYGAQGGTAKDAVASFDAKRSGGIINASRALIAGFGDDINSEEKLRDSMRERALRMNADIAEALNSN